MSQRKILPYLVLRVLQKLSRWFFRPEYVWVGERPDGDPWPPFRIAAILNHTSLYEALLAGMCPRRFLRRMADHCTIPIADVTIKRPIVGLFWRSVAGNIVPVSRERDHTWQEVLDGADDPESMVVILPEGRMKRADGLDKHGRPMRVRSGIADLLLASPRGRMLLCYSLGLHHIQVPGQHFPKLFRPVRCRFENIDIGAYRTAMWEGLEEGDEAGFRKRVIADLTARRDRYCTSDVGGTDEEEVWDGYDDVVRPGNRAHRAVN